MSQKKITIYSAVIADFILPGDFQLQEVLEHGWQQCSRSVYKKINKSTTKNRIFLKRDQNSFSFKEEYGYLSGSIVGEWFTVLRTKTNSLVIGAVTTADQFCQIFIKKENGKIRLRITCQFDGQILKPGEEFVSERVAFICGTEKVVLNDYVNILTKEMDVGKVKAPIKALCCSYYWNGNYVDEKIINKELDAIEKLPKKLNLDYIQIDAGYSKHWGDWLDYKRRFPSGFEKLIKRINGMGYKGGIWLAPFIADPRSDLFRNHGDWFLKTNKGKHFEARFTTPFDFFIPPLRFRVLDPTNIRFQRHLTGILRNLTNMGFELFKIDFLYPVCFSTNYIQPMTRAQALRTGVEVIRKAVGNEAHILTAINPMSPMVGLVDSARMGVDTLNPYVCRVSIVNSLVNNKMLEDNLYNNKIRQFLNGKIWTNDPDCLVFRGGTGIQRKLIKKHSKFAKNNNMSLWLGDSLAKLNDKEIERLLAYFG